MLRDVERLVAGRADGDPKARLSDYWSGVPPARKGDFLATHNVVGEKMTRRLSCGPLNKIGYGDNERSEDDQFLDVEEVTLPVFMERTGEGDEAGKTHMYGITALRYEMPVSKDHEKDPYLTLLILGGGGSEARGNVCLFGRIVDAVKELPDFPYRLRMVALPHIGGIPRSKGEGEASAQPTLSESAKILMRALEQDKKEGNNLQVTEKVGLIGFSLGGAQAIELASLLGERCEVLALCESGGLAEHPTLGRDFTWGTLLDAVEKYKGEGWLQPWKQANKEGITPEGSVRGLVGVIKGVVHTLRQANREMGGAWVTPEGPAGGLLQIAREFIYSSQGRLNRKLAEVYGLSPRIIPQFFGGMKAVATNVEAARTDSTRCARQQVKSKVVFAPVIDARPVNAVQRRLISHYPTIESLRQARREDLERLEAGEQNGPTEMEERVVEMLTAMFPQAKGVAFMPYDGLIHSSVMAKQEFWRKLMAEMREQLLEEKDEKTADAVPAS